MIKRYSKDEIMAEIDDNCIGWGQLYERINIMDLPWGDIKPDVKYVFMSQDNQIELDALWKKMVVKTKNKHLRIYRKELRNTKLAWDSLYFHPTYADAGDYLVIDTENEHKEDFDINKEKQDDNI